jgi:hypothetical protein
MFLHYKKNDNTEIFNKLEALTETKQLQNYYPLYKRYFDINDKNWNTFNLNTKHQIKRIISQISPHVLNVELDNGNKRKIFIKFSPLFDPLKYMIGKFKHDLMKLPKWGEASNPIYDDPNNVAYVDAFFCYLSSQLYHNYGFVNAIDFYGSYLGVKHNFNYNAADDIDILHRAEYFLNNSHLFKSANPYLKEMMNMDTRKHKEKLTIEDEIPLDDVEDLTIPTDRVQAMNELFKAVEGSGDVVDIIYEETPDSTSSKNSECSSRSSATEEEEEEDNEIQSDSTSSYDDSTATEDELIITIQDFPVKVICLEYLEDTLDNYLAENEEDITPEEWNAILWQIVITLYVYQNIYKLTHNDLHTNNIMYMNTDAKYLVYKLNGRHYRIPTFGKIYKIIDYGRSIYTFKGEKHMSSSFSKHGDAYGQYNTEPYYEPDKRRIEANRSFDLCRLGSSLAEFIEDEKEMNGHIRVINEWMKDDKGKNVIVKSNGKERYPGFKLYKMIARLVHNHTPEKALEDDIFKPFMIAKSKIKAKKIMDIDKMFEELKK